jgi:hypothetical protein
MAQPVKAVLLGITSSKKIVFISVHLAITTTLEYVASVESTANLVTPRNVFCAIRHMLWTTQINAPYAWVDTSYPPSPLNAKNAAQTAYNAPPQTPHALTAHYQCSSSTVNASPPVHPDTTVTPHQSLTHVPLAKVLSPIAQTVSQVDVSNARTTTSYFPVQSTLLILV